MDRFVELFVDPLVGAGFVAAEDRYRNGVWFCERGYLTIRVSWVVFDEGKPHERVIVNYNVVGDVFEGFTAVRNKGQFETKLAGQLVRSESLLKVLLSIVDSESDRMWAKTNYFDTL